MKKKSRKLWIIPVVLVVAVAGYFGYNYYRSKQASANQIIYRTMSLANGTVTNTVGATGQVRTNQEAVVAWQTSGTVNAVNVNLGDTVQAGQIIATLDPTTVAQSIITAQANLAADQQALDSLMQSTTSQAQAQQALATAQDAVTTAQNTYDGLAYPRGTATDIENAQTNYELAQTRLGNATSAYERVANYSTTDPRRVSALNSLSSAQIAESQALATLNWLQGKPTSQDIANAAGALAVAKAQLADAQRAWDLVKNGPNPADVAAAKAKIESDQAAIASMVVTAPFSGTITALPVMPGDLVTSGAEAFQIDDLNKLFVDLQVNEVDINKIKVGQPASLTFDAITNKTYDAVVTQVGVVGTASSGVVNYTVTVQVSNPDAEVKPGMTAAANVVSSSVSNVLVVPNTALKTINNQHIVYTEQNGQAVPVRVQLGATSDTNSEIISSTLKAGDPIILNPPTLTTTTAGFGTGGLKIPGLGGGGGFGGGGNFQRAAPSGGSSTGGGARTTGGN